MNHDRELQILGMALKVVLAMYNAEINKINDPKHLAAIKQDFERAQHYMLEMTQVLDELNCWFTAFGVDGNADENKRFD